MSNVLLLCLQGLLPEDDCVIGDLLNVAHLPAAVAADVIEAGRTFSYQQLLSAVKAMVPGVEVWMKVCRHFKVQAPVGMHAAAEDLCYDEELCLPVRPSKEAYYDGRALCCNRGLCCGACCGSCRLAWCYIQTWLSWSPAVQIGSCCKTVVKLHSASGCPVPVAPDMPSHQLCSVRPRRHPSSTNLRHTDTCLAFYRSWNVLASRMTFYWICCILLWRPLVCRQPLTASPHFACCLPPRRSHQMRCSG